MQDPAPILIVDRFPALLDELLALLDSLTPQEWERPTAAAGWSVKDVALHLYGGDVGLLSRRRDGWALPFQGGSYPELVQWINRQNEQWVEINRRISPRVLVDLLRLTGPQVNAFFTTLDLTAQGEPVTWAGEGGAPVWLDVAREFTERWHHQQHIRDAVKRPGATQAYFLAPVLAAFVHGLPRAYRAVEAEPGATVTLTISGEAGGEWTVVRGAEDWRLFEGRPQQPDAEMILPEDTAWRLFTKGVTPQQASARAWMKGDINLATQALRTISILA